MSVISFRDLDDALKNDLKYSVKSSVDFKSFKVEKDGSVVNIEILALEVTKKGSSLTKAAYLPVLDQGLPCDNVRKLLVDDGIVEEWEYNQYILPKCK